MKYVDPEERCIISGAQGVDLHHVISRGAGGSDHIRNLMPLSHHHHCEVHQMGLKRFAEKYSEVRDWLEKRDWVYDSTSERWQCPDQCRRSYKYKI